jgi:hypothetical protein
MQQFQQRIPTKASPYGVVHSRRQAKPAFSVTRRGRSGAAMAPEDAQALIDERTTLQALFVEYMFDDYFPNNYDSDAITTDAQGVMHNGAGQIVPRTVKTRSHAAALIKSWDMVNQGRPDARKIAEIAMQWYGDLTFDMFRAGVVKLTNPAISKKDTVREKFTRMAAEINTPAKFAIVKANHKNLFKPREMTALPTDPVLLAAHKKAQAVKAKKNADDKKRTEFIDITDGGAMLKTIPEVTYAFNRIMDKLAYGMFAADIKPPHPDSETGGNRLYDLITSPTASIAGRCGIVYHTIAKKILLTELGKFSTANGGRLVVNGYLEAKYETFADYMGSVFIDARHYTMPDGTSVNLDLEFTGTIREDAIASHITSAKFSIPIDILTSGSGFTCGGPCDTKRTKVFKCSKGGVEKRGCWVTTNTHAVSKHGVASVYDAEATARFARGEPIDTAPARQPRMTRPPVVQAAPAASWPHPPVVQAVPAAPAVGWPQSPVAQSTSAAAPAAPQLTADQAAWFSSYAKVNLQE